MVKRARERAGSPEPCMAGQEEEEERPTARKSLRRAKTRNDAEEKGLARVMELSIRIGRGGEDVDASLLTRVQQFLKQETIAGKCSLARGGSMCLLYFQMVVRIEARSMVSVGKLVERYLGWDKALPAGGVVACRALSNKGPLHTFYGMLGSCMMDKHEPHFQTIDHNVSAEELARGLDIFVMYGKEDKKDRVSLTQKNLLVHATAFLRSNARHGLGSDLESMLLEMVKSGKFYPSASWVAPTQEGRGMDMGRVRTFYQTRVNPSDTTLKHINEIFFQPPEEAFESNGGDGHDVLEGSSEDVGSSEDDTESASSAYISL